MSSWGKNVHLFYSDRMGVPVIGVAIPLLLVDKVCGTIKKSFLSMPLQGSTV